MATEIQWTDETWNPVVGCSKISSGCRNCYASEASRTPRLQQFPQYRAVMGWDGTLQWVPEQLSKPKHWRRARKIFVCSMSDFFHINFLTHWREQIFEIMRQCPQHTFQILTKRPYDIPSDLVFPDNAWLGVTVEDYCQVHRIDELKLKQAKVKFVSFEPLLTPLPELNLSGIDWAIIGGESGNQARPCHIEWIDDLIVECREQRVKIFVKQLGRNCWKDGALYPTGTKGTDMDRWPRGLRIREFPE